MLTVGAGGALTAAPAQAVSYRPLMNVHTGTCLTAGDSGVVFVSRCTGNTHQQWTAGAKNASGFYLLRNRATGKCLSTDYRTRVNAVWVGSCVMNSGKLWKFNSSSGDFLNGDLNSNLRTSSRAGAVYSDYNHDLDSSYYRWRLMPVSDN
ncbi:RICIN domain-containing protein [Kribbella soli]|nr:RICIN domain-containing protein [Kribbella soli]